MVKEKVKRWGLVDASLHISDVLKNDKVCGGKVSRGLALKVLQTYFQSLPEKLNQGFTPCVLGYVTLKRVERKARSCFNPKTKQKMNVPAKTVTRVVVGKHLRNLK